MAYNQHFANSANWTHTDSPPPAPSVNVTTTMNVDASTADKPRLTDQQKKQNHIESEKKRREAIRKGFEELSKIIPECEGQSRSEAVVLQKTVAYLRAQLIKKEELREAARLRGMSNGEFEQIYRDVRASADDAEGEIDEQAFLQ